MMTFDDLPVFRPPREEEKSIVLDMNDVDEITEQSGPRNPTISQRSVVLYQNVAEALRAAKSEASTAPDLDDEYAEDDDESLLTACSYHLEKVRAMFDRLLSNEKIIDCMDQAELNDFLGLCLETDSLCQSFEDE
jgi:hypothetical protein